MLRRRLRRHPVLRGSVSTFYTNTKGARLWDLQWISTRSRSFAMLRFAASIDGVVLPDPKWRRLQRCLSLRYTVTVFIEGRLLVYYCDSLVLALGVGDAANFVIVGSYEVASYFIDVVDLIAYFEAQIPLWISDGHVCVSCNASPFFHEDYFGAGITGVALPDPKW